MKRKCGYQIEEAVLLALKAVCEQDWAKPVEDVAAAALLYYTESPVEIRRAILDRYRKWEKANVARPRASAIVEPRTKRGGK